MNRIREPQPRTKNTLPIPNLRQALPVTVDLSKEGLDMVFKDYQVLMLQHMWEMKRKSPHLTQNSGDLWRMVNARLPEGGSKSRASVIFSANDFVDLGVWSFEDRTGKGGHHRAYYASIDEEMLWDRLANTIMEKLPQGR